LFEEFKRRGAQALRTKFGQNGGGGGFGLGKEIPAQGKELVNAAAPPPAVHLGRFRLPAGSPVTIAEAPRLQFFQPALQGCCFLSGTVDFADSRKLDSRLEFSSSDMTRPLSGIAKEPCTVSNWDARFLVELYAFVHYRFEFFLIAFLVFCCARNHRFGDVAKGDKVVGRGYAIESSVVACFP
jgi:hypothetical protein